MLVNELRESSRHRAELAYVVNRGPKSRGWDHTRKCFRDHESAKKSRDALKVEIGTLVQGYRVAWKVRSCRICHGFYVVCVKKGFRG